MNRANVSIREVAARAKVSIGTVSNVLNRPDIVATATRSRVFAAIDELSFVPNVSARQLRVGRNRTIGLVVLDVTNPFFTDVARGAEDFAQDSGYAVMLCNSDQSAAKEDRYLQVLEEHRVAGLLITPVRRQTPRLESLRARGIAVVLLDQSARGRGCCSVAVDDIAGGRLAAEHLIALGHEQLAWVSGPRSIKQCADRRKGMAMACVEVGLDPKRAIQDIVLPSHHIRFGAAAAQEILSASHRPTAAFCANDVLAVGVLQGLRAAGASVPDDVALIGYDDIDFASATAVPLTSVRQPKYELGHRASELLIDEAERPNEHKHEHVLFQPALIVRQSTTGDAGAIAP